MDPNGPGGAGWGVWVRFHLAGMGFLVALALVLGGLGLVASSDTGPLDVWQTRRCSSSTGCTLLAVCLLCSGRKDGALERWSWRVPLRSLASLAAVWCSEVAKTIPLAVAQKRQASSIGSVVPPQVYTSGYIGQAPGNRGLTLRDRNTEPPGNSCSRNFQWHRTSSRLLRGYLYFS